MIADDGCIFAICFCVQTRVKYVIIGRTDRKHGHMVQQQLLGAQYQQNQGALTWTEMLKIWRLLQRRHNLLWILHTLKETRQLAHFQLEHLRLASLIQNLTKCEI